MERERRGADVRQQLHPGMLVRAPDGKTLGRVVGLREHEIVIERGFWFRRRFTALYGDVERVETGAIVLSWAPNELEHLPQRELSGDRFTDTGEKEIATGVAEERRHPVSAAGGSGGRTR